MKLTELQSQFAEGLFYQHDDITVEIKETPLITPTQRLQVYRNSFIMGTTEALAMTYQHTLALVGEEFFNIVSREFILTHPPLENNIMTYGVGFNAYLETFSQLSTMPFISEMARFEWLLEQTSNNEIDTQQLDIKQLALLADDALSELQFLIPKQVALFTSQQNINLLYHMLCNDEVVEADLNKPCYLALNKQLDFRIELILLSKDEFLLLQQIQTGKSLGDITPQTLHQQLPNLLEKQLINGFTVN